jgi:serine/threonine protein kinase
MNTSIDPLQRYQVIGDKLGVGGQGTVFPAKDIESGKTVALKFLTRRNGEDWDRFRREARILYEQSRNRFVINIYGWYLDHERPFLVLEYCPQGSLRKWIGANKTWGDVALAMVHSVLGLVSIHEANGFHRDIKPDNLLVSGDLLDGASVVKLADFGVAHLPSPDTGPITQTCWGTRGYTAPEVVNGQPYTDKADVYSLGITAIEILSGIKNPNGIPKVVAPGAFKILLEQMTSVEPAQRPSMRKIGEVLSNLVVPAAVPAPSGEEDKFPWGVVIGGIAAGAAIVALVALLAKGGGGGTGA